MRARLGANRVGFRWSRLPLYCVPLLIFASLSSWALATPVGSSPDDAYHLASIWCGLGNRAGLCETGSTPIQKRVPAGLAQSTCEASKQDVAPTCQTFSTKLLGTTLLNTNHGYPELYYAAMSIFASKNIQGSVIAIRLVNAALFTVLTGLLYLLLLPKRRPALVLGLLVTLVPLGFFFIPSTNPSGWTITGCAVGFLAAIGYFESHARWRKIGLATVTVVGVLMAAGARGDGAVYVALAVIAGTILAARGTRAFWKSFLFPLPIVGAAIAYFFAITAKQLLPVINGVLGSPSTGVTPEQAAANVGPGLLMQNIMQLPMLWLGSFGVGKLGSLGWFDAPMPAIVSFSTLLAFGGVIIWGLRDTNIRKAIVVLGIISVITLVPLWFSQISHLQAGAVGSYVQPRYLYPGLVLLALVCAFAAGKRRLTMSFTQMTALVIAVSLAFSAALYFALRRYVDASPTAVFFDLNAQRQWWWKVGWLPDPMLLWVIAMIVFAVCATITVYYTVPHDGRALRLKAAYPYASLGSQR